MDGAGPFRIAATTLAVLVPSNARLPAIISYSTHPKEKMSARTSTTLPCSCPGAMYRRVPTIERSFVSAQLMVSSLFVIREECSALARPKLRTLMPDFVVGLRPRAPLHFDEDDSGPVRRDVPFKPADPFMLRDVVTILFDCRLRPEECYRLKWVRDGGIEVFMGKGRASRRRVPLSARLLAILDMRRTS